MRTMRETAGVEGSHTGLDIAPAVKLAPVIEDEFVEILVRMIKRYTQRTGLPFADFRHKGGNGEPVGNKGAVCGGRHWLARLAVLSQVAPVQPYDTQVALPAHCIQRIIGMGQCRNCIATLDVNFPNRLRPAGHGICHQVAALRNWSG